MEFIGRWALESHLWGVVANSEGIQLDRMAFSCCGGDGIIVESLQHKDAKLCGLTRRWSLLTNVFRQSGLAEEKAAAFWQQVFLKDPDADKSAVEHEIKALMSEYADEWLGSSKGTLFTWNSPGPGASVIRPYLGATIASILSWHYERVVLIARPGDRPLPINLWNELLEKFPGSRKLLLVDAASDLWNPSKLEPLEAVIAFAYERSLPIWIHFEPQGSGASPAGGDTEPARKARSFRQAVSSRLDEIRQKNPLQWMSPQSQSRLQEICTLPLKSQQGAIIPEFI